MDFDLNSLLNGLGGLGTLVVTLFLYPTVRAIRALLEKHDARLDEHGERIATLEGGHK